MLFSIPRKNSRVSRGSPGRAGRLTRAFVRGWTSWRRVTRGQRAMILTGGVRRFLRLAPLASALLLSGCDLGVLDPKGPIADANKTILTDSVAIMLAIVIPTIVAILAAAWWYRASNTRARYLPDFEYSGALELIVWAIPLLTIMLLGGVAWIGSHDLDPGESQSRRPSSHSTFRSCRSTGSGCSSTRTSMSLASIAWSSLQAFRSTFR